MKIKSIRSTVELFHLRFLGELTHKLDKRLYALKGGCNLRFFFNSMRYSEDIDIDVQIIAKETLEKKISGILHSKGLQHTLSAQQIVITKVSTPKQTQTTQRWKVLLSMPEHKVPIHTKIEFSRRKMQDDILFEPINPLLIREYNLAPILTNHYSGKTAFIQKLQALIARHETQSRDVFDLDLLINSGHLPKVLPPSLMTQLQEAQSNLETLDFTDFKSQVVAYLDPKFQTQYNSKSVWQAMQLRITQILEQYLNETY